MRSTPINYEAIDPEQHVESTTEALVELPTRNTNPTAQVLLRNNTISIDTYFPSEQVKKIFNLATTTWHDVDEEGFAVVFAFLGAFYNGGAYPFWLHIVGGPSSGKTDVALSIVKDSAIRHTSVDMLTPQTFLSGLAKGKNSGKNNSFLHRIGTSGLLCMQDFTTIMAQPEIMVRSIAGQLRTIFDGSFSKETGVTNPHSKWTGMIGIITAMTVPAFKMWVQYNIMGERFMALQWRAPMNSEELNRKMVSGVSLPPELTPRTWIRNLAHLLIHGCDFTLDPGELDHIPEEYKFDAMAFPSLDETPKLGIDNPELLMQHGVNVFKMAEVIVTLRTVPKRHGKDQKIGRVDTRENPFRMQQQLIKCVLGWAFINRRGVIPTDLFLARRIAIDSIPIDRRVIIEFLQKHPTLWYTSENIREETNFIELSPLQTHLQDLYALGIIETRNDNPSSRIQPDAKWKLTESFLKLYTEAFGDYKIPKLIG